MDKTLDTDTSLVEYCAVVGIGDWMFDQFRGTSPRRWLFYQTKFLGLRHARILRSFSIPMY